MKINTFLFVILISTIQIQAQEMSIASGSSVTSSNGSVSYSVGQVFYTSMSATSGFVIQGVQQPYEIYVISAIEDVDEIILKISVYPNPTSDYLFLDIRDYDQDNLVYQIYDLTGNLLEVNEIENNNTKIELSKYNSSIYFLKIIDGKKEIKTFKIIKTL